MSRERSDCKNCCDHPIKWEYLCEALHAYLGDSRHSEYPDTRMLEESGADGWELVTVTSKDIAIFKRRVRA